MHTYGEGVVVPEKGPSGEGSFERARLDLPSRSGLSRTCLKLPPQPASRIQRRHIRSPFEVPPLKQQSRMPFKKGHKGHPRKSVGSTIDPQPSIPGISQHPLTPLPLQEALRL